jgi:hypothetical protein
VLALGIEVSNARRLPAPSSAWARERMKSRPGVSCSLRSTLSTTWSCISSIALDARFTACKLVLHPQKTKLVYCKDTSRRVLYAVGFRQHFRQFEGLDAGEAVKEAFYQARKKIGDIRQTLPDGVIGPFFNDEFGDTYIPLYAITGQGPRHSPSGSLLISRREFSVFFPFTNGPD